MRDYEVIVYVTADPKAGSAPGYRRYLFRHCALANCQTALMPAVCRSSLDERLIDYATGADLVMVGDRGMLTSARVTAIGDDPDNQLGWITCLRAPAIAKPPTDDGPLQMTLSDTHDLAEITHPDYPGERLVACRNPALAAERARKRANPLQATEALLAKVKTRVDSGAPGCSPST
jgi:hypothetical protein